ncbi:hypothetical protein IAU60_000644 [Kwoniella sp. DSM 27419]
MSSPPLTGPTSPGRTPTPTQTRASIETPSPKQTYATPAGPPPGVTAPGSQAADTPTPTSVVTDHTLPTAPRQAELAPRQYGNPKVEELHQMFPTVEIGVIELVLETTGGSQDRAIEQLLAMTDPNFKPDELVGGREDAQVDLDAEFARSLQMEDEADYRRSGQVNDRGDGQLPYQPRVRRARGAAPPQGAMRNDAFYDAQDQERRHAPWNAGREHGQGQGQGQYHDGQDGANPPGMLMMEEKIERFAEVGKQTFNSLLSRAKAKYTEFQAQQQAAGRGGGQGYQPDNLSPSGDRYTRPPAAGMGGGRGGEQNRGGWDTRSPSVRSESISSQSTYDPPTQATPRQRWQPSDTYDDPIPPSQPMRSGSSSNRIEVMGGGRRSPAFNTVGSPEKTSGKIDPAKLGILPKKRVDLMSTSPVNSSSLDKSRTQSAFSPVPHPQARSDPHGDDDDDDPNPSLPNAPQSLVSKIPPTPPATDDRYRLEDSDDELEYTRNPFDEK